MPANLVRDLHRGLICTRRLSADWQVDDFVEKSHFLGCPLLPRIGPQLDENNASWPILPRLLTISPLVIEANNHTRFGGRQLLAQVIT